jgi:hypothetical protein
LADRSSLGSSVDVAISIQCIYVELPGSRLAALGWICDQALRLALPTLTRPRQLLFQRFGGPILELLWL